MAGTWNHERLNLLSSGCVGCHVVVDAAGEVAPWILSVQQLDDGEEDDDPASDEEEEEECRVRLREGVLSVSNLDHFTEKVIYVSLMPVVNVEEARSTIKKRKAETTSWKCTGKEGFDLSIGSVASGKHDEGERSCVTFIVVAPPRERFNLARSSLSIEQAPRLVCSCVLAHLSHTYHSAAHLCHLYLVSGGAEST